jgi:hypothetical protein
MDDTPPQMPPLTPARKYRKKPQAKTTDRDYGKRHRELRKLLLAKYPLCQWQLEGCTGWSEEADHLVRPATCLEHYQATCRHCHHKRHREGR